MSSAPPTDVTDGSNDCLVPYDDQMRRMWRVLGVRLDDPFGSDAVRRDSRDSNDPAMGTTAVMEIEPYRRSVHDEVMTSALVRAAGSLVDDVLDRLLLGDDRVTSAVEGKRILDQDDDLEQVTDRIQRFVALATPAVRTLARGAKFTRVPWVLVASTTASTGVTIRSGVKEVRVLASLVAHRLETPTGSSPDPALVKKVTLELYLSPRREPDVSDLSLPIGKLVRRWLLRGVLGRDTRRLAGKALDAAERLDVEGVLARRALAGPDRRSTTPRGDAAA